MSLLENMALKFAKNAGDIKKGCNTVLDMWTKNGMTAEERKEAAEMMVKLLALHKKYYINKQ